MAETQYGFRQCPTRIDGSGVLFAHKLSEAQCQDRQRGRYHKCFTCAFNNAYVAANGLPGTEEAGAPAEAAEVTKKVGVG